MAELSEGDLKRLIKELEGVKNYLPENLMGTFWIWCNQIRGTKERQPCSCKSSARHWGSCVEELRKYAKGKSE